MVVILVKRGRATSVSKELLLVMISNSSGTLRRGLINHPRYQWLIHRLKHRHVAPLLWIRSTRDRPSLKLYCASKSILRYMVDCFRLMLLYSLLDGLTIDRINQRTADKSDFIAAFANLFTASLLLIHNQCLRYLLVHLDQWNQLVQQAF